MQKLRLYILFLLIFSLMIPLYGRTFKEGQLRFPRVREAYREKATWMRARLAEKNLEAGDIHILIRAFKIEKVLELWVKKRNQAKFIRLLDYSFCASSGVPGPKREQGDLQIPEGYYFIDRFNAWSRFHLSLGINYPNALDRIRATSEDPGGDIFIHGNCVTIGCIPITDDKIKELYLLAVEAKSNGQARIPVHIFPTRMSDGNMQTLKFMYGDNPELLSFWKLLKIGYDYFEKEKKLPWVTVSRNGEYRYAKSSGSR